jgi:hypothetical protein
MLNNDEDYLPDMVAPVSYDEPEPEPLLETNDDEIDRLINDDNDDEEEEFVEIKKPEKLKQSDIFISTPSSQKKSVQFVKDEPEEEQEPVVKPVAKPKKKRKPMTEEHKKKLALAREKALATRRKNAELKRQAKQDKKDEEELVKKMRKKRLDLMRRSLEKEDQKEKSEKSETSVPETPRPTPEPKYVEKVIEKPMFSQADLDKAVANGIASYETIRKQRKTEKKKKLDEERHQQQLFNTINRAVRPNSGWDICFQ